MSLTKFLSRIFPISTFLRESPAKSYSRRLSRIAPHTSGRLRRSTLITLRWMAIIGQFLAFAIVTWGLKFDLPTRIGFAIIAFSALINIILSLTLPMDRRVSDREAVCQLGFDVIHLSALLWLTGGMQNPFAILYLAPVVTAATTLNRRVYAILTALTILCSLTLLFRYQPLPWSPTGEFTLPDIYVYGMWTALMVGVGFSSLFIWGAALESRRMSEALAATESVLAHEQKLAALGSLAAAAAHELGTPLATIQITAKEMERGLNADHPLHEDAVLLRSQAERCRDILHRLSQRGDEGDPMHNNMSVEDLLREALAPLTDPSDPLNITITAEGIGDEPRLSRQAELIYGLRNFIENALDFAESTVDITAHWDDLSVTITIEDDGPGFDTLIKDRLGEPYVSGGHASGKAGGLGLGVFISKTLIERTKGRVIFSDKDTGGAQVKLTWQRAFMARPE